MSTYTVTSQNYGRELKPGGGSEPTVTVGFETTDEPVISGQVTVPQSLTQKPMEYAQTVHDKIKRAIEAHRAIQPATSPTS